MLIALYHAETETLGLISPLIKAFNIPFKECHLYAGEKVPTNAHQISGLIVMGGPMNVDERDLYPFLKPETSLIEKVIAQNKPVLGICLGAQLIAKALGERVFPNARREVGWHPIHLTPQAQHSRYFQNAPQEFSVLHWHGDTFNLPQKAQLLASSKHCINQAFSYGEHVLGLQFHLEVTPDMVIQWVNSDGSADYISGAGENPALILNDTPAQFSKLEPVSRQIFSNFFEINFGSQQH